MSVRSEKQRIKDRVDAQLRRGGQLIESRSQIMKDPDYLKIAFRNMSIQEILVSMELRKMADSRER